MPTEESAPLRPAALVLRWVWLVVAGLMVLLFGLTGGLVEAALPALATQVHLGAGDLPWIIDGHLPTLAALVVPAAVAGELFGHARVQFIGVVWFTLGLLLTALATSGEAVVAARLVTGVGGALLLPAVVGYAGAYLSTVERNLAYALFALAYLAGPYLGVYLGGQLLRHDLTGRELFLTPLPLGLLALAVGVPMLLRPVRVRLDWRLLVGAGLALSGLLCVALAVVPAELPHLTLGQGALLGFGLLLVAGAVVVESWRAGIRIGLGAPLVLLVLMSGAIQVTAVFINLQVVAGRATSDIYLLGLAFVLGAALGAAAAVPAVSFVDGRLIAAAGLMVAAGAAAINLVLLHTSSPALAVYAAPLALAGFGTAAVLPVLLGRRPAPSSLLGQRPTEPSLLGQRPTASSTVDRSRAASGLAYGFLILGDVGAAALLSLVNNGQSDSYSTTAAADYWRQATERTALIALVVLAVGAGLALVLSPKGRLSGTP